MNSTLQRARLFPPDRRSNSASRGHLPPAAVSRALMDEFGTTDRQACETAQRSQAARTGRCRLAAQLDRKTVSVPDCNIEACGRLHGAEIEPDRLMVVR